MGIVTVLGYYGFKNAGDEAILAGLVGRLRTECPRTTVVAVTIDTEHTRMTHGVEAVDRNDYSGIIRILRRSDAFILGGGGLLQDVTSRRSLWYYLGWTAMARRLCVPTVAYGLGVGPIYHADSRSLIRRVMGRMSAIGLRDVESADELSRCGLAGDRWIVTGDGTLGLPPISEQEAADARAYLSTLGPPPYLGLALRPWGDEGWLAGLGARVNQAARRSSATVLAFSFQPSTDGPLADRFLRTMSGPATLVPPVENPRRLMALIGACDSVVAMRLHALVFAAMARRPAIGLAYDPKVERFARLAGYLSIPLDDIPGVDISSAIGSTDYERLSAAMETLRRSEAGNIRLVLEVAKRGVDG